MTTPTLKVEARWGDPAEPAFNRFVIGDATRGVIGNATYTIAPGDGEWVDISGVNMGLSSFRGRNRELDQHSAGTLSFTVEDTDRTYDLGNPTGPYYERIVQPGAEVRYSLTANATSFPRWQGRTEDATTTYDGEPTTAHLGVEASGPFAVLSSTDIPTTTAQGNNERTGKRLERLLNRKEVRWPLAERDIDRGDITLGRTKFGQDALSYAYRISVAEDGLLAEGTGGEIVFRGRHYDYGDPVLTFTDDESDLNSLSASFIPYSAPTLGSSTDLLYDRATGSAVNHTTEHEYEITTYRRFRKVPRSLSLGETLIESTFTLEALLRRLVKRYYQPEVRIATVTVQLPQLTAAQTAAVLGLDIGDKVNLVRTPPVADPDDAGDPITQTSQVLGISEGGDGMEWSVTFSFGTAQPEPTFIIGDPDLAVIGTSRISA